ncbi:NAD-dependent epimerase/dehydratase family protein [Phototrophicus methaneseepsis]|nr:NAD-dependent epimerase/dehydratase family protein [Phototrophicus methaneseepsis]
MMRKRISLITGANGEVGQGLIRDLSDSGDAPLLALDIKPLKDELRPRVMNSIEGNILDQDLLDYLNSQYEITTVFHLAAFLSTRAEFTPEAAHRVNVQGTINLLQLAIEQSQWQARPVKFVFPSSLAAYGLPDLETKAAAPPLKEDDYNQPITMYGCNKLYCEHIGRYYANHYRQLAPQQESFYVDFRSLRFPGLISAYTVPSGGTSDYVPEMLHAAAKKQPYASFVRPDTTIPFMAMPDAIKSLLALADSPREALTQTVYNVTSFTLSAEAAAERVRQGFPDAQITFAEDRNRQHIVDTWPAMLDDSAARRDWGWQPDYDEERAFNEYLIPVLKEQYSS